MKSGPVNYPSDHEPAMEVPEGGSMCANCEYLADNKKDCKEEDFIRWNGSEVIPGKITAYCSDWYKPASVKPLGKEEAKGMTFKDILESERPVAEEHEEEREAG